VIELVEGEAKKKRTGNSRGGIFQSIQTNLLTILERINAYMAEVTKEGGSTPHTDAVAPPKFVIDLDDEELEVDFINDITLLSERIMSNLSYSIDDRIKDSNAKAIMKHFRTIRRNLRPAPSLQQLQKIVSELSQIESMISEASANTYIV
jgi:hypothetical protein